MAQFPFPFMNWKWMNELINFSCNLSFPFQKNNSRFWLSSSSDDKLKYESLMFLFRFGWEDKLDISWAIFSEFTKERMREKWIENELIHFLNSSPKMWINSHSHSSWKKWINSHSKMNWNRPVSRAGGTGRRYASAAQIEGIPRRRVNPVEEESLLQ